MFPVIREAVQTVISTLFEAHIILVYVVHTPCSFIVPAKHSTHIYNELQMLAVVST
jgi:hypothetical protein